MDRPAKSAALDLIQSEHIMTLATSDQGQAWAAPVYYVYSGYCFWFFSSPSSRHISSIQPAGSAAAAIYAPSRGWRDIRGLQMQGHIEKASSSAAALGAVALYIKRFSFISELLPGHSPGAGASSLITPDLEGLEKAFRAKWYCFIPERIYYSDNSISFGYRECIELP